MTLTDIQVAAIDGPLREWLDVRAERGQDTFDEVWNGVLHVAPAERPVNGCATAQLLRLLGAAAGDLGLIGLTATRVGHGLDYRVPDALWVPSTTALSGLTYLPTAKAVLETLSPGEAWELKAGWYADHGIGTLLLADPDERTLRSLRLTPSNGFEPQVRVFGDDGPPCADVVADVDWG